MEYKDAKGTHYNNSSPKLPINKDNETCSFQGYDVTLYLDDILMKESSN
jgi:hypothetical protein